MGVLDSVTNTLGLTPDLSGAIGAAGFDPFNINTSFGSSNFNAGTNTFDAQLNPQLQGIQQGILGQLGQVNPEQQLSLFRQQAQP